MKILHVCKSLPYTYKGGIQTHTWELSKKLINLGEQVHILSGGSFKKSVSTKVVEGRTIIELPFFPGRMIPFLSKSLEDFSFNLAAYFWLKKNYRNYDIIHFQGRSGFFFSSKRISQKINFTITFHGITQIEYSFANYSNLSIKGLDAYIHQKVSTYFEKRAYKNASAVIVVSEEIKRLLHNLYQKPKGSVHIVSNGIDPTSFVNEVSLNIKNKVSEDDQYLTYIGRLETVKGLLKLPNIVQHLNSNIKILVIGEGSLKSRLEKEIRKKNFEDRFLFTGALSAEEIKIWLQKSTALLLPSEHEPQGIVLLEANMAGVPVIASDIGGIDEVVVHGQNGLLVDPSRPEAYAEAINYIYDNPNEARKMGNWGREWVLSFFNWTHIAEKTRKIYFHICSKRKISRG